ncbi:hypothetical protein [Vibrio harveyi]|uniref:hypothetical protein n=1 Tax=Vibrio harveyi TaxID=669 RepID=UPI00066CBBFB|nr:hypothetical protein [Vibrio harveyi]
MKENLPVFIDSIESKMIRYKEHERKLRIMHHLLFRLAVSLMLIGILYPVLYLLFPSLIHTPSYFDYSVGYYLGYIPVVLSVCTFLYIQMFFPKERIISVSLLNNRISSVFDDYTLGLIPVERFKTNVEVLIDDYISTHGNTFFLRNNY